MSAKLHFLEHLSHILYEIEGDIAKKGFRKLKPSHYINTSGKNSIFPFFPALYEYRRTLDDDIFAAAIRDSFEDSFPWNKESFFTKKYIQR